jgi:hypothetical protein
MSDSDYSAEAPSSEVARRWWPFVGASLLVWPVYYVGALLIMSTGLLDRLDRASAQWVVLAWVLPLLVGALWGVVGVFRRRGGRPVWLAILVAVPGVLFAVLFGGGLAWSWLTA